MPDAELSPPRPVAIYPLRKGSRRLLAACSIIRARMKLSMSSLPVDAFDRILTASKDRQVPTFYRETAVAMTEERVCLSATWCGTTAISWICSPPTTLCECRPGGDLRSEAPAKSSIALRSPRI